MSIIGGTQINNNKGDVFNATHVNQQSNNNDGDVFNQVTNSTIKIGDHVYHKNYNMYGVVTGIDWPNVYLDFIGQETYFFLGQTCRVCRYTDLFIPKN